MKKTPFIKRKPDTSWQKVANWYNKAVGDQGLYFHQKVILPKILKLLNLTPSSAVLDLACGQGILARYLPKNIYYQGFDLSEDLIKYARNNSKNAYHRFDVADVSLDLKIKKNDFTHLTCILALQNIENFRGVFENASKYLAPNGKMILIINHPYFRIPRQTSWGIDTSKKVQYRRIDRYLTSLKVPINMAPGSKDTAKVTWSFHNSLESYTHGLKENGFVIETIEEWVSDKQSQGKAAKMENRARSEFPMFMTIVCRKISK